MFGLVSLAASPALACYQFRGWEVPEDAGLALEELQTAPGSFETWCKRGILHRRLGDSDGMLEAYQRAEALAPTATDAAYTRFSMAIQRLERGENIRARDMLTDIVAEFTPETPYTLSIRVLSTLGASLDNEGQYSSALPYHQRALDTFRSAQAAGQMDAEGANSDLYTTILTSTLAGTHRQLGNLEASDALYREGQPAAERLGDPRFLTGFDIHAADQALKRGDAGEAQARIEAVWDALEKTPPGTERLSKLWHLGSVLHTHGQQSELERAAAAMIDLVETDTVQRTPYHHRAHITMARSHSLSGRPADALASMDRAIALAEETFGAQRAAALAEQQNRFDTLQKESDILVLQEKTRADAAVLGRQRTRFWTLLALASLLLGTLFLVSRRRQAALVARAEARALEAKLEERTRVAREVHDSLLQGLFTVTLNLQRGLNALSARGEPERKSPEETNQVAAAAITEALDVADQTIAQSRRTILEYREGSQSPDLTLRQMLEALEVDRVRMDPDVVAELPLVPGCVEHVSAILAEAVRNARRHGSAGDVVVEAGLEEDGRLAITVQNPAERFDADAEREGHYGILGMRERAAAIGAELDCSHYGGKAVLRLILPAEALPLLRE